VRRIWRKEAGWHEGMTCSSDKKARWAKGFLSVRGNIASSPAGQTRSMGGMTISGKLSKSPELPEGGFWDF